MLFSLEIGHPNPRSKLPSFPPILFWQGNNDYGSTHLYLPAEIAQELEDMMEEGEKKSCIILSLQDAAMRSLPALALVLAHVLDLLGVQGSAPLGAHKLHALLGSHPGLDQRDRHQQRCPINQKHKKNRMALVVSLDASWRLFVICFSLL